MTEPQKSRTIVILADTYTDYQRLFIDPLTRHFNALGYGVLVVTGRELRLGDDNFQPTYASDNCIYAIVKRFNAAGIIVMSGCVGHNLTPAEIETFLNEYRHFPLVSLGVSVSNCDSVAISNTAGMRALMEDLLANPRNRRYIFIRGFEKDFDSRAREAVFRECLAEHGLPVCDSQFLVGNYIELDAFNALDEYLEHSKDIDVVVAANDHMAAAAINALRKHGLRTPEDVVVAGYDDSLIARDCTPPITTVSQPIGKVVDSAAAVLLAQIEGNRNVGEHECVLFDGQLVVRESSQPRRLTGIASTAAFDGFDLIERIRQIVTERFQDCPSISTRHGEYSEADVFSLLEAVVSTDAGYPKLESLLLDIQYGGKLPAIQRIFWTQLERKLAGLIQTCVNQPGLQAEINRLLCVISVLRQFNSALEAQHVFFLEHSNHLQSRLRVLLARCRTVDEIADTMEAYYRQCGVTRAFLVQYQTVGKEVERTAVLKQAYGSNAGEIVDRTTSFHATDVLPQHYAGELDSGLLVLGPLSNGDNQYGYLLIETDDENLNIEYLTYALSLALENIHYLNVIEKTNQSLEVMAKVDTLTGLLRREAFEQRVLEVISGARNDDTTVGILFIDLDGFKMVNDTKGHHAGDLLLAEIGKRIISVLRNNDNVARLGGDEFAVLLTDITSGDQANAVAERLLSSLCEPILCGADTASVSASIGVAMFPEDGNSVTELLKSADKAMYTAKNSGKNCVVRFYPELAMQRRA